MSSENPYHRWIRAETTPVPVYTPSGQYVGDLTVGTSELRLPDGTVQQVRTSGATIVNEYGVTIASPQMRW